ncbi:4Fe-4S dicluster domain-containing protein [Bradyrhizobium sp. ISRA443]|uniref:4Fe-4S dicluster domain-containing protein n=1 Tax=unclassified Bradyrhizobium TaxID=2631580 RepID=UPI002478B125|nr:MULTISPECIES: 4Fe-4S dicluster domain-containing protein [unclassified Bradyrhizobium]WGR98560.1 4Fe-4S dicluster domain-containing protein [Bradyrhizobium sp. ISRA436]WGS05449.1 4Fe-4S dicluster domain-containing protein [Bradyrhizobium sp. ISRA437]WGS12335.1 4Fe-4S dicluster domain-containing protein [Bradyrhizobium sp. ISRA443]
MKVARNIRHDLHVSDPTMDRRAALKLFMTGVAATLASCGRPPEEIVPYVQIPERATPGVPLRFASALPLAGYGRGVLVTSVEGRPIKIEGNPRHPASLGSTDVYGEATVLSLYDPDRSKAPHSESRVQSWSAFHAALGPRLDQHRAKQGEGLAILTGRITSPSMIAQLDRLKRSMPQTRWYRYEAIEDDAIRSGVKLAFGRLATALPRFRDARVVLTLDGDPIGVGPEQIRYAREIVDARRPQVPANSLRLYSAEPDWSLTGALADHRVALRPELIRNVAIEVARAMGAPFEPASLPDQAKGFAAAAAADLQARRGAALVTAGPRQPSEVHALCHWINGQLQAPVDFIAPVDPVTEGHTESLRNFVSDVSEGQVETLIILDANPVYDAPGSLGVDEAIKAVPFKAHFGGFRDETAQYCTWHLPLTHVLERWSDIRTFDGTASIIQPLLIPLYDSRDQHQILAMLQGEAGSPTLDIVRNQWRSAAADKDRADWWRQILHDGVVANSAFEKIALPPVNLPKLAPATVAGHLTLALAPDPSVFDGGMANNAWLQECPKPFTSQVWGNALHVAESDARELGLRDGEVVQLKRGETTLEVPALVREGQAAGVLATTLGYGRRNAGTIGTGIGFDVYPWRSADSPWLIDNVTIARTGRRTELLQTQHFFDLESEAEKLQPRLTLANLASGNFHFERPGSDPPTLYPPVHADTYEWAMAIDASACIGCNACIVACQAENNVPVVGPDEIAMGRDMHWMRIDHYVVDARPGFSPTPCMHCEHAPCEPVCPVAASIHDSEGLNVQVYNRCVGTRFCESNCPYKVRRFNFAGYADGQEYGNLGEDIAKAVFNPNVTVRSRGVMEKCTYCVQRISVARRAAEREGRAIREGEVVTACQAACPTKAIHFGDMSDSNSRINALRADPRSYSLLGELGTRPRTTYLARLHNPNSDYGKARS